MPKRAEGQIIRSRFNRRHDWYINMYYYSDGTTYIGKPQSSRYMADFIAAAKSPGFKYRLNIRLK